MTAALILAAGSFSDDSANNPMEYLGGISFIKRIIKVFKNAAVGRIVVVTGYNADILERHCAHMGVVFLRNNDYANSDMLSSVKIGLRYLEPKCERAFITPVNIPLFSVETLIKMLSAEEEAVIPIFNNKTGHPLLLAVPLFEHVLEYDDSDGLEGALSGNDISRSYFEVADEGVVSHLQSAEALSGIVENHCLRNIRPETKIKLSGEKAFFGPGTFQLLTLTGETGSLKLAAQQMGLSYSKAWKMIADIEDQLAVPILHSRQGGQKGGGSELSAKALDLMRRYEAFESECDDLVRLTFHKYFSDWTVGS